MLPTDGESGDGSEDGGEGERSEAPAFEAAREHVLDLLVSFVRTLRWAGVGVPADGSVEAARALAAVGFDDRERVRAALRAALVSSPTDSDAFDQQFPTFWRQLVGENDPYEGAAPQQGSQTPVPPTWALDETVAGSNGGPGPSPDPDSSDTDASAREETRLERRERVAPVREGEGEDGDDAEADATAAVYSPTGSRERMTAARGRAVDDDLDRALVRLTEALGSLRGRRWDRGGAERPDARRALRRSVGAGGAVLPVPERERDRTAVRATLLVDVSRSVLDAVDRGFLLDFLERVRGTWRDVRIFFFDTDLREVSDAFADRASGPGPALERAEAEWGGGTRIGHAVETVRREHRWAVDRRSLVFVVSDGLEVGEIEALESGMAWLSRRAAGVVWCNPLAASPEYEPTCRGMAAALPYVDGLFAFAGPGDVAEMARQLDRRGLGGRVGSRYDPRRRARQSGSESD